MLRFLSLVGALLLATPSLAQQVTPSFGLDSTGTMRQLSVRDPTLNGFVPFGILNTTTHSFVAATTPVEMFGAKGDSNGTTGNGTNDTAAIEACVASGQVCSLRPGATYRLMSAIDIPSNGGLIGDKTATLYCDPAGINNTDNASGGGRYAQTAMCIKAEGASGNPAAPVINVLLKDFRINWGGNSGNRCCQAVDIRNAKDAIVDGLEVYNLSAYGIRFASWQNGRIVNNYVHDASNDTGLEYSAIQGDDDILSGLPSDGVQVSDNRIVNILVSETGYNNTFTNPALPDGYQTNGIKIVNNPTNMVISGNRISYTGQCIDFYGDHSSITGNIADHCVVLSIALKHGASYNVVSGNTARYAGAGAIGSNGDDGNPNVYNILSNNTMYRVGETDWPGSPNNSGTPPGFLAGIYAAGDSNCMGYAVGGIPNPNPARSQYELVTGNTCDPGPNGKWAWYPRSGAFSHNYWMNNYGQPGTAGIWATGDGMKSLGRHAGAKIDAFVPWIDVPATVQINLSQVDGNLLNITGASVINDFIGGEAGQYYYVRFNGVMTLRCTGFLACPGGVNITTAAGDVMLLTVDVSTTSGGASAYKVLFYQRAGGASTVFNSGLAINLGAAGGTALAMTNTKDDNTGTLTSCSRQRSGTAANSDELCSYVVQGKNSAGSAINFGGYNFTALNVGPGSETGAWRWYTAYAGGGMLEHMRLDGGLRVAVNPGSLTQPGEGGIAFNGKFAPDRTLTATGTTGAQTINKPAGTVNFAAGAASLVVTNSLVSVFSIVLCTVQTNDTTMKAAACAPTSGSFTIHANANPTGETKVGFLVLSQ